MSNDEFQQEEQNVWLDFLNHATTVEIHQAVIDSNWDGNGLLINWIKDNPNVDRGTILIAYWMSGPGWFKQYLNRDDVIEKAEYNLEQYDIIEELEHKYISGFFKENKIEMDPESDQNGYNWTTDYQDEKRVREIPEIMFQKLPGEKIIRPEGWEEGLPPEYYSRIEKLIQEYDIVE
jgi:hypothetical protein